MANATLEQLRERAHARVAEGKDADLVVATVHELGLCVNAVTGEVYDPAPAQVNNYPYDAVNRRRGRYRR